MSSGRLLGMGAVGLFTAALSFALVTRSTDIRERQRLWRQLERRRRDDPSAFHLAMVAHLPDPARRYFAHAIAPGTPLASSVELRMGGSIRLSPDGAWMPLRARQILAPPMGFVWEATVGRGLLRFSGADYYVQGDAEVNFRLWGLVPFVRASDRNIARSARGRLVGEALWNPAALLPQRGVIWEAIDEQSVRATLTVDGEPIPVTLAVKEDGHLVSVTFDRWGDRTDDGRHALIPFGCGVLAEGRFGGYTIPTRIHAGWWFGTGHYFEFARFEVERATFR